MPNSYAQRRTNDFGLEVAKAYSSTSGQQIVTGHSIVHKFGKGVVGTTGGDIWNVGGYYPWPTAGITLGVVSNNAADTATGLGARTVTIQGLSTDWSTQEETLTMAGTGGATGTASFVRINRAFVATAGQYARTNQGGNHGDLTIYAATSTSVSHARIEHSTATGIRFGQTQVARYTVPAGKNAYLTNIHMSADGNKNANIHLFKRDNAHTVAAPFTAPRLQHSFPGVAGEVTWGWRYPMKYGPRTDLWMAGEALAQTVTISADMVFVLVDETTL